MGFWGRLWGGAKRVARSCYRAAKSVVTTTYRTVKTVASTAWNGIKTGYRKVKSWISSAKTWVTDKVKQFGNWTRNQLNKTWVGKQCVKAWDFTVGGGFKNVVKKFENNVRGFLGKSKFGRGLLSVYDGCKSVVNKVMDKYNQAKDWCQSRLKNMGFAGELLSDALSVGTDYVLPLISTGGLGKVMNIINKIKAAGNPALTALMNQMPIFRKVSDMKSKMSEKLNSVLKNPRIKKFYDEIQRKYNQIDNELCDKLDVIENFMANNTLSTAASKLGDKLKQAHANFDQSLFEKVLKDEENPVSYEEFLYQEHERKNRKCCICLEKVNDDELIAMDCCRLTMHHQCYEDLVKSKIPKPGNQISLQKLSCIHCRKRLEHDSLTVYYDKLCDVAGKKLSYDKRKNDKELVEEKNEFYQNPEKYAMKLYSFHICYACKEPYCSGERSCVQDMEDNKHMKVDEYLCLRCKPSGNIFKIMKGHGVWLCPNDHVYFIANCTGTNQSAQCQECGVAIGNKVGAPTYTAATGNRRIGKIDHNGKIVADNHSATEGMADFDVIKYKFKWNLPSISK